MTTYRFQELTAIATRKGRCPTCDKRVTRSHTFVMTVSPFNKNPDGTVRTWGEVREAVIQLAADWDPPAVVFEHLRCAGEAQR